MSNFFLERIVFDLDRLILFLETLKDFKDHLLKGKDEITLTFVCLFSQLCPLFFDSSFIGKSMFVREQDLLTGNGHE